MNLLALRRNVVILVVQSLLLDLLHSNMANGSVVTVNDLGNLLQSRTSCLDIHEVDEDDLTEDPDGVDEVESPGVATVNLIVTDLPSGEGQRVQVVVQEEGDLNGNVQDHETLSTERVGENLNTIANEETRPAGGVEDTVEPDKENHGVVGSRSLVLFIETASESPEDEDKEHATSSKQEGEATVKAFDKHSTSNRDNHIENGLSGGDDEAVLLACQSGVLVEDSRVVGDNTVSRPLREDTKREENNQAVSVALGLEEVHV